MTSPASVAIAAAGEEAVSASTSKPVAEPITTTHEASSTRAQVKQPQLLAPLSADRHKVQFTASTELREKIERVLRLMSHRNPSQDIATAVEYSVDLAVAQLEKERLGKLSRETKTTDNPATKVSATIPTVSTVPDLNNSAKNTEPMTAAEATDRSKRASRSIPRAVRREVFKRDGLQCAFVSDDGVRCEETSLLQVDHVQPHARGGKSSLDNVRILCFAHNQFCAEQAFGRSHMKSARSKARNTIRENN